MSRWDEEQEEEKGPLVVRPYVAGMSEDSRRVCRKFNIFNSGWTLDARAQGTLPLDKQSNVLYPIPCRCYQVYIG